MVQVDHQSSRQNGNTFPGISLCVCAMYTRLLYPCAETSLPITMSHLLANINAPQSIQDLFPHTAFLLLQYHLHHLLHKPPLQPPPRRSPRLFFLCLLNCTHPHHRPFRRSRSRVQLIRHTRRREPRRRIDSPYIQDSNRWIRAWCRRRCCCERDGEQSIRHRDLFRGWIEE